MKKIYVSLVEIELRVHVNVLPSSPLVVIPQSFFGTEMEACFRELTIGLPSIWWVVAIMRYEKT